MRILIQSVIGSVALHALYIVCTIGLALVRTYFYQPQFAPDVLVLQQEVAFGYVVRFPYVGLSFFVVTMLLVGLLLIKNKRKRLRM